MFLSFFFFFLCPFPFVSFLSLSFCRAKSRPDPASRAPPICNTSSVPYHELDSISLSLFLSFLLSSGGMGAAPGRPRPPLYSGPLQEQSESRTRDSISTPPPRTKGKSSPTHIRAVGPSSVLEPRACPTYPVSASRLVGAVRETFHTASPLAALGPFFLLVPRSPLSELSPQVKLFQPSRTPSPAHPSPQCGSRAYAACLTTVWHVWTAPHYDPQALSSSPTICPQRSLQPFLPPCGFGRLVKLVWVAGRPLCWPAPFLAPTCPRLPASS